MKKVKRKPLTRLQREAVRKAAQEEALRKLRAAAGPAQPPGAEMTHRWVKVDPGVSQRYPVATAIRPAGSHGRGQGNR